MRVTLFASVSPQYNPYIALLQQAVQPHCEEPVLTFPRLTPEWVLRHGRGGSIAHMHWIESHLAPQPWFGADATGYRYLVYKLGNNRLSHPVRAMGLLLRLAAALEMTRRIGVHVVYTVHNLTAHRHIDRYYVALEQWAQRIVFKRADAVHVHSPGTAGAVSRLYGRTRNVFIVPHGNYIGWYPNTLSRAEARARLGLAENDRVILCLGQIAPYKGLEHMLEAFASLDDASTKLMIVGRVVSAGYGTQIAALAQRPGVIYRPGFVPDEEVQLYLNAADVMALPYARITTSGSVMLALSFGRPVVAPALDFLVEVVPPSAGVLYAPEASGGLAEALRRACSTSWSSTAILAHTRQYDWRIVGAQMAEVYRAALRADSQPALSQDGGVRAS